MVSWINGNMKKKSSYIFQCEFCKFWGVLHDYTYTLICFVAVAGLKLKPPSCSCFLGATWWCVDVARIQSAWPWQGRLQLTRSRWSDSIDLAAELPALQEIQSVLKQLATESGVVGGENSDMICNTEMGLEMENQELMGLHHSMDGLQDFFLKCLRCKGKGYWFVP